MIKIRVFPKIRVFIIEIPEFFIDDNIRKMFRVLSVIPLT
jgi:hypothetical protein